MNRAAHLLLFAALALPLAACSKVTADNYSRLKPGMAYEDVRGILGKPDKCSDLLAARSCTWGDDKSYISVTFVGDQAVLFQSENIR
ncbi:hypothetical protein [Pseudothauera rhizosphaerae]|uniref:Beta-barrel assembly machine subunit BamE n=1 Tax=Pseudothauera rhizosphaerae TaxID=2565932 RepID=A0A4S4AMW8_9RHOO|nr:hypothetical protein [Pseudothauera rhizosphaerae]THF60950.1 hypothetical protein E6O51_12025 [Pseudothauera rhizosphaerae]